MRTVFGAAVIGDNSSIYIVVDKDLTDAANTFYPARINDTTQQLLLYINSSKCEQFDCHEFCADGANCVDPTVHHK